MGLIDPRERRYLEGARVGRLATADADGRPHAVPVCFAFVGDALVTPVDEKPKAGDPSSLRRVRDVTENPAVALVVDHYSDDWSRLGWVQIRGTASLLSPDHADHALEDRPVVRIDVGSVVSWGDLARPAGP